MSKTKAQLQEELDKAQYEVDKFSSRLENEVRIHKNSCQLSMERFERINELIATLQVKEDIIRCKDREIHDLNIYINCLRGLDYQGKPFPDVKGGS